MNCCLKLFLMVSVLTDATLAQSTGIINRKNLVNDIIKSYSEFDYQKCSTFIENALNNIENFQESEKILIYQYAAFLAFHNSNINGTAQYFRKILELNPGFSLDTITTPPKILAVFQKTRIEFFEELNQRAIQFKEKKLWHPFPWRALFPGWEHWHRGHRLKGTMWGTLAAISLTGTIVSIIQTNQLEKKYVKTTDLKKIESSYHSYRSAYRRQYYFGYAFCAILLLSQIDLAFTIHPMTGYQSSISFNMLPNHFTNLSISFQLP